MQFNPYSMYAYQASDIRNSGDDKILVDLQRLKNINEFDEVIDYVNKVFGEFEGGKIFDYPNDVKVIIKKEENAIEIGALQKDKEIFGQGWYLE